MLAVKNDLKRISFIIMLRGTTDNADMVKLVHTTGIMSSREGMLYAFARKGEAKTKSKVNETPKANEVVKAELRWSCVTSLR